MLREHLVNLITARRGTEAPGGEGLALFTPSTNRKLTYASAAPMALSCTPAQCQCGTRNVHSSSVTGHLWLQTTPSTCQPMDWAVLSCTGLGPALTVAAQLAPTGEQTALHSQCLTLLGHSPMLPKS